MFVLNPYASDFFLGEGSHSKVFAAELHEGEDVRKIALKVMKSEDTITEDMLTEMRCMSKLIDSPHVVQLQKFKFPKDDSIKVSSFKRKLSQLAIECPFVKQVHNSFCIAMEQMDTSVHVLLYDKDHLETLSFPMILSWIKQLLLALSDCHKKGIIHRDVKPHNLLVNRDRSILKLSDFSIAKEQKAKRSKKLVEDELVTPQMVTLFYRAPEILKGSVDYSYATDIWSIGAVAAELFQHLDAQEHGKGFRGPFFFRNPYFSSEADPEHVQHEKSLQCLMSFLNHVSWTRKTAGSFSDEFQSEHPDVSKFLFDCLKLEPLERPSATTLIETHSLFVTKLVS